jgi:hypothetical protein
VLAKRPSEGTGHNGMSCKIVDYVDCLYDALVQPRIPTKLVGDD